MKKSLSRCLLLVLIAAQCLLLTACGGPSGSTVKKPDMDENTEFIFTGSSDQFTGGRTFNITVTGAKDGTIDVVFAEMPMASMGGTWTFVEGKGYKITFSDGSDTLCYTAYDPETLYYSFVYAPSLGEGYGSAPVTFTMADPDFAKNYDGEGLGLTPPVFDGVGYFTPGGTYEVLTRLVCREDGSCVLTDNGGFGPTREGTWTFDEAANVYSFDFPPQTAWTDAEQYRENRGYRDVEMFDLHDDQGGAVEIDEYGLPVYDHFETTYDEATNTYTLETVHCIMGTDFMHSINTFTRLG